MIRYYDTLTHTETSVESATTIESTDARVSDFFHPLAEGMKLTIVNDLPVIEAIPTVEADAIALSIATTLWKEDRQALVNAIEVTHNTVVYQGDEESQNRMGRVIIALPDDTTTVPWTAKDNSVHNLTKLDMQAILLDAGSQQSALWNTGRPVL